VGLEKTFIVYLTEIFMKQELHDNLEQYASDIEDFHAALDSQKLTIERNKDAESLDKLTAILQAQKEVERRYSKIGENYKPILDEWREVPDLKARYDVAIGHLSELRLETGLLTMPIRFAGEQELSDTLRVPSMLLGYIYSWDKYGVSSEIIEHLDKTRNSFTEDGLEVVRRFATSSLENNSSSNYFAAIQGFEIIKRVFHDVTRVFYHYEIYSQSDEHTLLADRWNYVKKELGKRRHSIPNHLLSFCLKNRHG